MKAIGSSGKTRDMEFILMLAEPNNRVTGKMIYNKAKELRYGLTALPILVTFSMEKNEALVLSTSLVGPHTQVSLIKTRYLETVFTHGAMEEFTMVNG